MAATAYSSLVSLMNILTRYQHPTCPVSFDQSKIQNLLDKVSLLVDFLESFHNSQTKTTRGSTIQDLEKKMTRAAHAAEDVIESYFANRVRDRDGFNLYTCVYDFSLESDLENAICAMDQIIREWDEVGVKKHKTYHSMGSLLSLSNQRKNYAPAVPIQQKERGTEHGDPLALTLTSNAVSYDSISTSSSFPPRDKKVAVGVATKSDEVAHTKTSEQLNRLMNRIRDNNPKCQIIPIVGMGGIGKTTLATNALNSQYTRRHFDIRAWVTISQNHVVQNIIVALLQDIKVEGNDQMDYEQLKDKLYQELCGRRYIIVLDDIWDIRPWMEIRRLFPDNNNGSRILLTTRDHSVARGIGSSSTYEMEFMGDDESFNLLSEKVCGLEVFPLELEIVGKTIARSCKGLPLAVVVISGLLKTCSKTLEYWTDIAENFCPDIWENHSGQCLEILSMSYTHLPIHLKPCFLHMAAFEEDERVDVSKLINLWIAEGFIKPTKYMIFGEIALEYLDDLIDRNLIMVGERSLTRKIKTVSMHDSLRELCLREAQNENFLAEVEKDTSNLQQLLQNERRISFKHSSFSEVFLPSMLHVCSLYVTGWYPGSTRLASSCRFLRVMDSMYFGLETKFVKLANIRYLAVSLDRDVGLWLSCSLTIIWNLQTLILTSSCGKFTLPSEIWGFSYIQHLEFQNMEIVLPDPTGCPSKCVLKYLKTISGVGNFFCTDEVFGLIPNLKELRTNYYGCLIGCDKLSNSFSNLALLPKLEILEAVFSLDGEKRAEVFSELKFTFSPTLVELELKDSKFPWEDMTIVGCLPNLQVLNLKSYAFYGDEWNPIEGQFQRLQHLSIFDCPLSTWNAESSHFPRLERLRIYRLGLKKIPMGIGEITSLELIDLIARHNISIITSLVEILEERKYNQGDDDDLVVTGHYQGKWSKELAKLKEWAQAKTFLT